ncbi:sigma-70 family RNA polymerase sigma factor [Lichenihabitans sp. Uapishka_5]|uniref:sigma-70 family RNA polymerase sigma factor n=1 Tax=Lichenihabitans sp. Uapishka_5 TaxID=3037302 RepID=UPI0029E7F230|nr:sigma-70 family RNA polymerase sigma factor [Lichenihabitans sp. Uapishka_5]MDX7949962.1 sigma-70 family RNA polymerase sigma factor [Lichenihabitans sp. Uapishka_5]
MSAEDAAPVGSQTANGRATPAPKDAAAERSLKQDMLSTIPSLRAFAFSLCGNADRADDLVQETLMKAWINQNSFTQGTSMSAWLFTILRNVFYSEYRKRRREVEDAEGTMAARLVSVPEQNGHMDLQDLRSALQKLPAEQREALILVGGSGFAYEEAAQICGCALGTLKSRVNRARNAIATLLALDNSGDVGRPDWQTTGDFGSMLMWERN